MRHDDLDFDASARQSEWPTDVEDRGRYADVLLKKMLTQSLVEEFEKSSQLPHSSVFHLNAFVDSLIAYYGPAQLRKTDAPAKAKLWTSDDAQVERTFNEEKAKWCSDTLLLSDARQIVSHESYLRIIGLGKQALPHIFNSLIKEGGLWFPALKAITGVDIITENDSAAAAAERWIVWGKANGYTEE